MPFYGYATIPKPSEATPDCTFMEWHVKSGAFVHPDTKIASIQIDGIIYTILICFPALVEKLLVENGDTVSFKEDFIKWNADGESIPYGKNYFRTEIQTEQDAAANP